MRPHMLLFNTAGSHAVIAFVASGHVAILRAKDRKPVACFRTTVGAGGARQAHAAYPSKYGARAIAASACRILDAVRRLQRVPLTGVLGVSGSQRQSPAAAFTLRAHSAWLHATQTTYHVRWAVWRIAV